MPYHPLQNYLRTHRRRFGLSQAELAALLGSVSGTKISRYETLARLPAVTTIWAYEVVFSKPARELFAGAYEAVELTVRERAQMLLNKLAGPPGSPPPKMTRKLAFLRAIVETKSKTAQEA